MKKNDFKTCREMYQYAEDKLKYLNSKGLGMSRMEAAILHDRIGETIEQVNHKPRVTRL